MFDNQMKCLKLATCEKGKKIRKEKMPIMFCCINLREVLINNTNKDDFIHKS